MLKTIQTNRRKIENEVFRLFSNIKLVKAIYSSEYDIDLFHFQILTNNSIYNRPLMMKLFDIEYEIEDKFPSVHLTFEYIPRVHESKDDVVIKGAKLIYRGE